ncbi:MAG: VanZ family protein [Bacteroidales bacterium]|nr:VanZ family protein [Lachnoclostridium sp.]MCM1382931.1 VanZ family protein [Lachnoclostridium sp.]MCM1465937.1 VanZ family protein [Bacteroidales bacterium]
MIYDVHIQVLLVVYAVIVGILIACYIMRKQKKRKLLLWRCLFVLYLLLVMKVTVFPFTFEHFPWMESASYIAVQWKPFASIISMAKQKNYIQIVGNIILLMPLPLLLQGIRAQELSRVKCVISIAVASLSIEVVQLGINLITKVRNHVFDVDDLMLNILGGIFLVVLYKPLNFVANAIVSMAAGDEKP